MNVISVYLDGVSVAFLPKGHEEAFADGGNGGRTSLRRNVGGFVVDGVVRRREDSVRRECDDGALPITARK